MLFSEVYEQYAWWHHDTPTGDEVTVAHTTLGFHSIGADIGLIDLT
jgi:hypothetical protein